MLVISDNVISRIGSKMKPFTPWLLWQKGRHARRSELCCGRKCGSSGEPSSWHSVFKHLF